MYYHASPAAGLTVLEPRLSEHGTPLVYFSEKRENVLVYLSNAVERVCRATGFVHEGAFAKWGPYGFDPDGRQRIEEYWPNALEETYRGVSGWIYAAERIDAPGKPIGIPFAATSTAPVEVCAAEFVPDALDAILRAERSGLLAVTRYAELSDKTRAWLAATIRREYAETGRPEYRHFLREKFPLLKKNGADGAS